MAFSALSPARTIHLLELHPGPTSSVLSCKIHQACLGDPLFKYKALSYCWGDSATPATMYVDGKAVKIGHNLDLCINLQDPKERSRLVAMMKDIYAGAEEVVVWLGEEGSDTLRAFRLLHGLADLWDMAPEDAKRLLSSLVRNQQFRAHWLALGQFLGRAWWQRIWVLQEIVMARKSFVLCGRWAAEWDQIERATASFKESFIYIDELQESNIFHQSEELRTFRQNAANLLLIKRLRIFVKDGCLRSSRHDFSNLLELAKDKDTTEPRDKIYALLGIGKELKCPDLLEVDYAITACQLYMRVCQVLYHYTGTVNFLELIERDRIAMDEQDLGLPDWCPDWRAPSARSDSFAFLDGVTVSPRYPNSESRTIRLEFTRGSTSKCKFDLESKRLMVKGFKVDRVRAVEMRWVDLDAEFRASLEPTKSYGKRICWHLPSPEEEHECNIFWSSRLSSVRLPENENELTLGPPNVKSREVAQLNTSCFKTQRHQLLGQTNVPVQQGDYICAFLGARMPYILRLQNGTWRFIGQW
ncbi:uncharacterized protein PV06_11057 [Exophiala oligosperma]|uniref:Heterokaryon incompatibility domain-containing protein n=1 Tax=Exophiala oligosperma TaxID=215243 RepID=A0A0D2D0F4_9EURO|nr:uncharacterized protein PV06_11057 [Exophiala oligosperma]KIW36768.1 hypothetical protein PV06_11057 [Exophiala oligosperma]